MANPKVSIIVPNYNHAQFLEQRLDSIFNQTFRDYEVILLDDCSTDKSIEIINRYKKHPKVSHFISNQKNSGSTFIQWEKGISLAKGEFIWIAESDDYCEYTFLEELMNNSEGLGLVYSQSYDVDDKGIIIYDRINYTSNFKENIWKTDFELEGSDFVSRYLLFKNVVPNASAVIFKRELINENTFSDALLKMKMCGDWLFWIKISSQTKVFFLNKYLNYFRNHKESSRTHNTLNKMKKRLKEESTLRSFLYNTYNLKNKCKDFHLISKWSNLFKVNQILSSEFCSIKSKNQSWFDFYYLYFKTKIKL